MSDSEVHEEDYVSDASAEDESPESELDDEEHETDEYDNAIERYAELIREVPEDNLNGIVENVEKIFEYRPKDNTDDVICGVLVTTAVLVFASMVRVYFL